MNDRLKFRAIIDGRVRYDGDRPRQDDLPKHLRSVQVKYFSEIMVSSRGADVWFHETKLPHATNKHFDHIIGLPVEKVEQCTGIKDCDGVLIFEGDIVNANNITRYVEFYEEMTCFSLVHYRSYPHDPASHPFGIKNPLPGIISVIGNIHDEAEEESDEDRRV